MAKKKVMYSETYRKNAVGLDKEKVIELINQADTLLFAEKTGRHDDDTEFLTLTIEGIV